MPTNVLPPDRQRALHESAASQIAWCRDTAHRLLVELHACADDDEREYAIVQALSCAQLAGIDVGMGIMNDAIERVVWPGPPKGDA